MDQTNETKNLARNIQSFIRKNQIRLQIEVLPIP